jgi:hypothetical protein
MNNMILKKKKFRFAKNLPSCLENSPGDADLSGEPTSDSIYRLPVSKRTLRALEA